MLDKVAIEESGGVGVFELIMRQRVSRRIESCGSEAR